MSTSWYYFSLCEFFTPAFHWILGDNKSPRVSRSHLSILTDRNNVVGWIVSILPLISNAYRPFSKLFLGRSKGTNYNCNKRWPRVPQLFKLSGKVLVFVCYISFFIIPRWSSGTAKCTRRNAFFFFFFFFFFFLLLLLLLLLLLVYHTHTHIHTYLYIYNDQLII